VTPQERYLRHAEHLALIEAARAHPAEDAMRGIDLDGNGRGTSAHGSLVAAWLESRGEALPGLHGILELVV
jgi:hypothetical protein